MLRLIHRGYPPGSLFLGAGLLAGLSSLAAMAWRGRVDAGAAAAALNAPSHWVHGREALRQDAVTPRHTLVGVMVHLASAMFWAGLLDRLHSRRRKTTQGNALVDAAAVSALAAVVDLKLVPHRLTPGFQERLSSKSLALVYGSFAAGLFAGMIALRR